MHVHRPVVDLNALDLYAARAAEKAAELKKAAELRRKLLKAGATVDGDYFEFGGFLVGERSGRDSRQNDEEDQAGYADRDTAKPASRGTSAYDAEAKPLSIWA